MSLQSDYQQMKDRADANARALLGDDRFEQLTTPTSLTYRLGRVITSIMCGHRTVETRSYRIASPPTRRGGSSTGGRETNLSALQDRLIDASSATRSSGALS